MMSMALEWLSPEAEATYGQFMDLRDQSLESLPVLPVSAGEAERRRHQAMAQALADAYAPLLADLVARYTRPVMLVSGDDADRLAVLLGGRA